MLWLLFFLWLTSSVSTFVATAATATATVAAAYLM